MIEIRQTLLDTENALKDFIEMILKKNYGEEYISHLGLSEQRISVIEEQREIAAEQYSQELHQDYKLIDFINFIDIKTILKKHWESEFQVVLGKWEETAVFLDILDAFHQSDANNRQLITYQKHLILGICGSLRNKLVTFRSWKDHAHGGFAVIESVMDNFGNIWTPSHPKKVRSNITLREGDILEFVINAKDAEDRDIEYRVFPEKWTTSNVIQVPLQKRHTGKDVNVHIAIRSESKQHAYPLGYDDRVTFVYDIIKK